MFSKGDLGFHFRNFIFFTSFVFCSNSSIAATFTPLGDLPGGAFDSQAMAVSADGNTVVGKSASQPGNSEAFRWTLQGGMVGLGYLTYGNSSEAKGVSSDGSEIVGWSETVGGSLNTVTAGFSWTSSTGMKVLPFTGEATALGVNGNARYGWLGSSETNHGAHIWYTDGTTKGYGPGSMDRMEVTGISDDGTKATIWALNYASVNYALLWNPQTGSISALGDLPGGQLSYYSKPNAISNDGSTVVGVSESANGYEAFRWTTAGGIVSLGFIPGTSPNRVEAHAVSADGTVIVGESFSAVLQPESNAAFIWDEANGMRNLQDVLVNQYGLDLTGWYLQSATGISADSSVIVGTGVNPDGNNEAWIVTLDAGSDPVPADVDLTVNSSNPVIINEGSDADYLFTITNDSSNLASDVALDITFTGPIAYSAVTSSQGQCTNIDTTVNCTLGSLVANTGATVTLTVTGAGSGQATVQGTVTTSDNELVPTDNIVSRITTVNAQPLLTIITPATGAQVSTGDTISFQASATDSEDGDLSANVQWASNLDGVLGTGGQLDINTLSAGVHLITASVIDSNGSSNSSSISLTVFAVANDTPVLTLISPTNGSQYDENEVITLSATASDTEDGDLSAAIQWNSNISGQLGTGSTLSVTLPAGVHTITAQVSDSVDAIASVDSTITVSGTAPPVNYCSSSGSNTNYEWINSIAVGTFSLTSGNNYGYGDYTGNTISLARGNNSISLSPGFGYGSYYEYWRIWIDYNQDGVFDSAELTYSSGSSGSLSGSITVPTTALAGNTRMRISMRWGSAPSACGTFSYGEVEDYTANIAP